MKVLSARLGAFLGCNPIRWWANTRKMEQFIAHFGPPKFVSPSRRRPVGIIVGPWLSSDVTWFAIAAGLFMAAAGEQVVFVVDDAPFGLPKLGNLIIRHCIRKVLKRLSDAYEIVDLKNFQPNQPILNKGNQAWVETLAEMNATWALKGESRMKGREGYKALVKNQLFAVAPRIEDFLSEDRISMLFVPGGVYGSSGLWAEFGKRAGIRVATYDSAGPDGFMLASDGIAAQMADIPRAVQMGRARPTYEEELPQVLTDAYEEMAKRRSGTDKFASQASADTYLSTPVDHGVLIALNSPWDSAALGLHAVFDSSVQWVCETVRWVLENTSVPAVVRQHPSERLLIFKGTDDFREILHAEFGNDPRVVYIAAEAPVNTYDLLECVDAVAVYTSTIGVEAAALGKRVVTPSHSYYSELGFVLKSTDRDSYFGSLAEALSNPAPATGAQTEALYCFYMTQCCNWFFSPFCPEGFDAWIEIDPTNLLQDPMVRILVQSVLSSEPAPLLNHAHKLSTRVKPVVEITP